jgi:hypothetical protein
MTAECRKQADINTGNKSLVKRGFIDGSKDIAPIKH